MDRSVEKLAKLAKLATYREKDENAQIDTNEVVQTLRGVISSEPHVPPASVDREHTLVEECNEPLASGLGPDEHPQGTDDDEARNLGDLDADEPALNVEQIIARFVDETKNRFRPGTPTASDYSTAFRRFAGTLGLADLTKKQLTPKRAHKLVLDYMSTMKPGSKRWILAALECVWVNGGLGPWPVNIRRDFGRSLPRPQRREAPTDADVRPFAEALRKEPNSYMRLFVRMVLTYGLRPADQLGALRWQNVRYNDAGRPVAIVARGVDEGFKTGSPIIAHIPSDLANDLIDWRAKCPNAAPEAPLLPRMGKNGKFSEPAGPHGSNSIIRLWIAFREHHEIRSTLTMAHMRHWVKRAGRKTLDPAVLAYWQGHDAKSEGGGMSLHYGTNLPVEEVLEEQSRDWPDGPLGDLMPVRVQETPGVSQDIMRIVMEYVAGDINELQMALKLGEMKQKAGPLPEFVRR